MAKKPKAKPISKPKPLGGGNGEPPPKKD